MAKSPDRAGDVRAFLIEHADGPAPGLVTRAATRFGISRQAAHLHLAQLVREGLIHGSGRTRARTYRLATLAEIQVDCPLGEALDEDAVWDRHFAAALADVPAGVVEICRHGLTECLRNAADHSGSAVASVRMRRNASAVEISVADRGEGVFRRLDPADPLRAALDLVKGGKSSDPSRRSGRGVASVARAFEGFSVWSGHHLLRRELRGGKEAWHLEELGGRVVGTTVVMRIRARSRRTLLEAFARSTAERKGVAKPRFEVPVRLALRGSQTPTSRAAARRLLERLEAAGEIVLDFSGVPAVGPAFADEVFRVFRRENPDVELVRIGTVAAVERVLRAAEGSDVGPKT